MNVEKKVVRVCLLSQSIKIKKKFGTADANSFAMKLFIWLFFVSIGSLAVFDSKPLSAPQVGEGFTDDYRAIVGEKIEAQNILELDKTLNHGKVLGQPWSSSYWPTYKGLIASRYADPNRPQSKLWSEHYAYYLLHPSADWLQTQEMASLSPAEKYDLLVGDSDWGLTQYMWSKGAEALATEGVVTTWTGLCHGWAGAAQVGLPRSEKTILVRDVTDQYEIPFYPFDIMALSSYLYSKINSGNLLTGRRCRAGNLVDSGGRNLNDACLDANPMTWHLSVVLRTGLLKKTFAMDTSSGSEVWNYVIDSYQITYFNPRSGEVSPVLQDGILALKDYLNDPFRSYRSSDAVSVVGIQMDVFHPAAISPRVGTPARQVLERKRFFYDLELDSQNHIVGGEWHSKNHPDFLWRLPEESNPFFDAVQVAQLMSDQPVVTNESSALAKRFSRSGKINSEIVYRLLAKSLNNIDSSPIEEAPVETELEIQP